MVYTWIAILIALWLLGIIGNVGGNLIHLLLGVALMILLYQLATGKRIDL
jgi:hypothetical protein